MPTTRKRRSRAPKEVITPDLVAKFKRWKDLSSRRGAANTPQGILLSESEESEYQEICSAIDAAFHGPMRRPWDMATPLYESESELRPDDNFSDSWEAAISFRHRLEEGSLEREEDQ